LRRQTREGKKECAKNRKKGVYGPQGHEAGEKLLILEGAGGKREPKGTTVEARGKIGQLRWESELKEIPKRGER